LGAIPFEACLDALPLGAILVTRGGQVLYANPIARRMATGSASVDGSLPAEFPFLEMLAGGGSPNEPLLIPDPLRGSSGPAELRVHVKPVEQDGDACRLVVLEEVARGGEGSVLQIVSMVRHEINNSLMGLLGQVELLLERADLSEAARKKVGQVQIEAEKIRRRVADLSTIGKP
jgi:signal transduction histidine kinase